MQALAKLIRGWIVSENYYNADASETDEIDWFRAIPFILLNLSCFLAFYVHFSWIAFNTCACLYFFRLFTIGAFYHRYFSHKAFKTSRLCQFIFAALAGTSAQRGPLWWASHHRQHHMVSDKAEDVHSPVHHGFWTSHVGWFLTKNNFNYNPERVKDLERYPELVFLDRYDVIMPSVLFFSLFLVGWLLQTYSPQLQTGIPEMLVWGFSVSLVALFNTTVIINSLCHIYGTKRYKTDDSSKNNLLFALLTLGEGWHNNHHYYPASARQGFVWWEIDITYYLIKLMELLGIVWDVKSVPQSMINQNLIEKNRE